MEKLPLPCEQHIAVWSQPCVQHGGTVIIHNTRTAQLGNLVPFRYVRNLATLYKPESHRYQSLTVNQPETKTETKFIRLAAKRSALQTSQADPTLLNARFLTTKSNASIGVHAGHHCFCKRAIAIRRGCTIGLKLRGPDAQGPKRQRTKSFQQFFKQKYLYVWPVQIFSPWRLTNELSSKIC